MLRSVLISTLAIGLGFMTATPRAQAQGTRPSPTPHKASDHVLPPPRLCISGGLVLDSHQPIPGFRYVHGSPVLPGAPVPPPVPIAHASPPPWANPGHAGPFDVGDQSQFNTVKSARYEIKIGYSQPLPPLLSKSHFSIRPLAGAQIAGSHEKRTHEDNTVPKPQMILETGATQVALELNGGLEAQMGPFEAGLIAELGAGCYGGTFKGTMTARTEHITFVDPNTGAIDYRDFAIAEQTWTQKFSNAVFYADVCPFVGIKMGAKNPVRVRMLYSIGSQVAGMNRKDGRMIRSAPFTLEVSCNLQGSAKPSKLSPK